MIPYAWLFNRGQYEENGVKYYRYQNVNTPGMHHLKFTFGHANTPYEWGIAIMLSKKKHGEEFRGKIWLNGERLPKCKMKVAKVIEPGQYPENTFELRFQIEQGGVLIFAVTDRLGDYPGMLEHVCKLTNKTPEQLRYRHCWTSTCDGACAFWIEDMGANRYRYHCNDHVFDDDFDDMTFDVEFLPE